ncbi:MAG: hypothetical protein R2726_23525 [Acidimicrobiales bacterium]
MNHPTTPRRPGATRGALQVGAWIAVLGAIIAALDRLGDALPPRPDPRRPGDTLAWVDHAGAVPAAVSLLRLAAVVLAWYLLVTTVVGAAARVARWQPLVHLADAVTLPRLRRFLHTTVGTSALVVTLPVSAALAPATAASAHPVVAVAATPLSPTPAAPADGSATTTVPIGSGSVVGPRGPIPSLDPPVMRRLEDTPPPVTSTEPEASPTSPEPSSPAGALPAEAPAAGRAPAPTEPTGAPPRATRIEEPEQRPAPASDPTAIAEPSDDATAPAAPAPEALPQPNARAGAPEGTWRIEPGDHLWHVAESTLQRVWGRVPSTRETASYLGLIIDANRPSLAVADNPDLVFAGQVFVLPSVDA